MMATMVEPKKHRAYEVGDEPLLLARHHLTVVSRDRATGARLLIKHGCDFVIMDDGFQNRALARDFSLVVMDEFSNIGNGFTIPAGPLRLPLESQLPFSDAVLIMNGGSSFSPEISHLIAQVKQMGKPVYKARLVPDDLLTLRHKKVLAFAGIADPEKFYKSLRDIQADIVQQCSFPDHHFYSQDEVKKLLYSAEQKQALLATTAKDWVRLHYVSEAHSILADKVYVLNIKVEFGEPSVPEQIIQKTIINAHKRSEV